MRNNPRYMIFEYFFNKINFIDLLYYFIIKKIHRIMKQFNY
ncbi:hypothetical protein pb186bvf_012904 [Paramecium bursaria]